MTSKQRAELRKYANGLDTIYQIGKGEIDGALIKGVGEALNARELIKLRVHDSSDHSARDAAGILAQKLGAYVVQIIGGRFVLYKWNKDVDKYGIRE